MPGCLRLLNGSRKDQDIETQAAWESALIPRRNSPSAGRCVVENRNRFVIALVLQRCDEEDGTRFVIGRVIVDQGLVAIDVSGSPR